MITINVLGPISEPSDGIVVRDSFPRAGYIRHRYWGILAYIKRDVFGSHSELSH